MSRTPNSGKQQTSKSRNCYFLEKIYEKAEFIAWKPKDTGTVHFYATAGTLLLVIHRILSWCKLTSVMLDMRTEFNYLNKTHCNPFNSHV